MAAQQDAKMAKRDALSNGRRIGVIVGIVLLTVVTGLGVAWVLHRYEVHVKWVSPLGALWSMIRRGTYRLYGLCFHGTTAVIGYDDSTEMLAFRNPRAPPSSCSRGSAVDSGSEPYLNPYSLYTSPTRPIAAAYNTFSFRAVTTPPSTLRTVGRQATRTTDPDPIAFEYANDNRATPTPHRLPTPPVFEMQGSAVPSARGPRHGHFDEARFDPVRGATLAESEWETIPDLTQPESSSMGRRRDRRARWSDEEETIGMPLPAWRP